jgi:hypothetical protein
VATHPPVNPAIAEVGLTALSAPLPATVLTLVVIPILYAQFTPDRAPRAAAAGGGAGEAAPADR